MDVETIHYHMHRTVLVYSVYYGNTTEWVKRIVGNAKKAAYILKFLSERTGCLKKFELRVKTCHQQVAWTNAR